MQSKIFTSICLTLWCLFFILSAPAHADSSSDEQNLNGLVLPTTDISCLWLFSQKLSSKTVNKSLENAAGFKIDLDIPIWNYFHAGFYFEGARGFVKKDPGAQFNLLYNPMGAGIFLKPQVEIPIPYGNLALSIRIPLGYELPIGNSLIPTALFDDQGNLYPQFPQYGFKTGAALGLAYFPIYILGIFIEAGYQISYHNFATYKVSRHDDKFKAEGLNTVDYLIHGGTLMAGIKIAY